MDRDILRNEWPGRIFLTMLAALLVVATPFLIAHATQEKRRVARMGPPVPIEVDAIQPAVREADRRLELRGGTWRCDQMEGLSGRSLVGGRIWIPIEDSAGKPRLLIEEFEASTCQPRDPVAGMLTRDGGLFGATLPARGKLFPMSGLPILVIGSPPNYSPMLAFIVVGDAIFIGLAVLSWRRRG